MSCLEMGYLVCDFCFRHIPLMTEMMDTVRLLERDGRVMLCVSATDEFIDVYIHVRFCPFCGRELK